ncbi:MAG TPA: imidazolonepropionase [Actinomycetota bacterium]|nr:imidazolonepropionase [Actinomycetota bacterium]
MGEGTRVVVTPTLVTCSGDALRRGAELERLNVLRPGALAWTDGTITYAGPPEGLPESLAADRRSTIRVDGAVLPGFVDCHTHLPFYGWRADEFEARLAGHSYRDLHGEGGIYRSARLLSEASDDEVIEFCRGLTDEMLAHGTTALELKTGYGLSVEAELRQARLARRLAQEMPQTATVTLLACHAVPQETSHVDWVDRVCRELIPVAASEGLADAVDVYVEDIAFSVDDLRRVAESAGQHGLPVRCHADQLGESGAAEAAVSVGARSADHLNHVSDAGVGALANAETVGVLLPVSTLFLRSQPPLVNDLVEAGVAIALATDFNPGTSPCLSIPEVIAVGASLYGMPTNTAITAATVNAAWVLGLNDARGSLEPGKEADFVVLDAEDPAMMPYRPGHNPVAETWIAGTRLYSRR